MDTLQLNLDRVVRRTSVEAYNEIKASGLLKGLQERVYSYLYEHGPSTAAEVYNGLPSLNRAWISTIRARITELNKMGAIEVVDERPCKITHTKAMVWDVTGFLPNKVKRAKKELPTFCPNCGVTL